MLARKFGHTCVPCGIGADGAGIYALRKDPVRPNSIDRSLSDSRALTEADSVSQFQSPYQPHRSIRSGPGYHASFGPNPLCAGLRGLHLMLVMCWKGRCLLVGMCAGLVIIGVPEQAFREAMSKQKLPPNMPAVAQENIVEFVMLLFKIVAGLGLVAGAILIFLAVFVRRGSKTATVFAIIFCGLAVLAASISL